MGTVTTEQSYSSMAKVLCIIAWAGLVTAAPYYEGRRAGSSVDTEAIVDTVMKSLDLNQVIAQAMKGLSGSGSSFTGTFTQLPQSTLKISGTNVGQNSLGRYSGVSTQGGSRFSLQSSNSGFSGSRSGSSVDKTAVVGKVLTVLNPQIEKAVAEAIRSAAAEQRRQAALIQQQQQAALREQQRIEAQRQAALIEQQRQAALIEQQRQAALREQQRIEAQRQAALLEQQRQAAFAAQQ